MAVVLPTRILLEAVNRFGTPLYCYHADRITEQYQKLRTAFSDAPVRFFYAAKALTNLNILKHIHSIGCSVDCSSINEVKLAQLAGFLSNQILYTSNSVHFSEIEEAVEAGVYVNVDSLTALEKFGKKFGNSHPIGLRLRPNIMAGGNLKISTGHADSKFGIPIEQLSAIQQLIKQYTIRVETLHIHTGSEIKEPEVFLRGVRFLLTLAPQFPHLQVIDLGGGFKVPYHPTEKETDLAAIGSSVKAAVADYVQKTGKSLEIWFEPGKFLVSEAGVLLTAVNVVKDNGAYFFAGVDTGLNHLIRPMLYDAYHPIENISNPSGPLCHYQIVGNICETDTLGADRDLPEIREGDILAIKNAGAYGFEMASHYNARCRPAEVVVHNDELRLVRKRESLQDLLRNQQDIV
jgi:diaminopimelate decarboxylase